MNRSMRVIITFALTTVSLLCAAFADDAAKAAAREIANKLRNGKFEQIHQQFNSYMAEKVSTSEMKGIWDDMIAHTGAVKSIGEARESTVDGHNVIDVRCECENAAVNVRVGYDGSGKIEALWVRPLSN